MQKEIEKYYQYLEDRAKHHGEISRELYERYNESCKDELKLREAIYNDGLSAEAIANALAFKAMFRGMLERKGS